MSLPLPSIPSPPPICSPQRLLDKAKRVKVCPWCGEGNGTVKKCPGSLKILHDRYGKGESEALLDRRQRFEDAAQ